MLQVQSPFMQLSDTDGKPLNDGKVFIGQAGQNPVTSPLQVFWDEALTLPVAQPIFTSGGYLVRAGTPARVYTSEESYSITVLDKKARVVYSVLDATSSSNLATQLSGSSGASLVGFIQTGVGAVPRTLLQKAREIYSVKDYGATGDGVTNDTVAVQKAIDEVSASGGGELLFTKGIYQVTGLNVSSGVVLVGEGGWASILRSTDTTASIAVMSDSSAIRGLKLLSSVTRTGGFYIDIQGNGVTIENCEFGGYFIGVNVGSLGGTIRVADSVKNCLFRDPSTLVGSGAVQFMNFSNAVLSGCVITGNVGVQPSFGVRFQNGDTAFVERCNITIHGKALLVDTPAGYNCYALNLINSLFDSAGTIGSGATVSCAEIIPAGRVWNTLISGCWFGLAAAQSGLYLSTSGAGAVDGLTATGCEFTDNGDCGLIAVGTGVKNWVVVGGHSGGNANAGIRAASGTSDFIIVGHKAGNVSGRGPNNYGVFVDLAASSNFIIADNVLLGNTIAPLSDSSTGFFGTVVNNVGYNNTGAPTGLSVGASPWQYQAGHTPEQIFVMGGTVSDIAVSGTTVQNTTNTVLTLSPNEAIQIVYSVAPTILKKRM